MSNTGLNIHIRDGDRTLVHINNFTFNRGKITFLFGESGIGKSMICKALYGLLDPDELRITINGREYREYLEFSVTKQLKQNGFFVFQEPSSHLNPLFKIEDQLNEGSIKGDLDEISILKELWDHPADDSIQQILDIYPKPYRPSGGEKQRFLLAMAFKKMNFTFRKPDHPDNNLYIFDEPTGSLDNHFRNIFIRLLFNKFTERHFTSLFITHDYSIISEIINNHRRLLGKIDFKELTRTTAGTVELDDFSPENYITWLKQLKNKGRSSIENQSVKSKVLTINKNFRVFRRNYTVYHDEEFTQPADLVIHSGEIVYLRAGSGIGKTTLAKILMGLQEADEFEFEISGIKLNNRSKQKMWKKYIWGRKTGMVFQHADEALDLEATIRESLEGLKNRRIKGGHLKSMLGELFENDIDDNFLSKKVKHLSGGQKQRLNLVRTLAVDVDLVILDEPLNGLDFISIRKTLNWLKEKQKAGKSFLIISHNEEIFENLIDSNHTYFLNFK
ncbi:MAG: ATP-binding cassette domain-containing protein [Calditrichaceae bacterium]